MPKLPQVSGAKLIKILLKDGWDVVSQKGSHVKLRKYTGPIGKQTIIVPNHKVIKKGTLSGILRDSNLDLKKLTK